MQPTEKVTTEEATEVIHEEKKKKTVKVSKIKSGKSIPTFQLFSLFIYYFQHFSSKCYVASPNCAAESNARNIQVKKRNKEQNIDWLWFPAIT